jgi:hypothetical protein
MTITRQMVAGKLADYLHHQTPLTHVVDWAENAVMSGEFAPDDAPTLTQVVARLGLADVRAFGLTWEDCEQMLRALGYAVRLEVVPA